MRDVPDDIRAAAFAVVERGYDEGLLEAVERALMAERAAHMIDEPIPDDIMKMAIEVLIADATVKERERCAKIARMWLADWEGLPIDNVPAGKYAADAVKDILDAIRRGTS